MLQGDLFPPASDWRAPRLSDLPQDWTRFSRISLDTETRDELLQELGPGVRRGAYIVGYCLAFEGEEAGRKRRESFYLPVRHLGGDNMDEGPEAVERYLREQAARYRGDVVGARLDYDLDFCAERGILFSQECAHKDVQVAEPLLDELQFTYGLNDILRRHGLEPKDERMLEEAAASMLSKAERRQNVKKHLWKFPARYVGAYGQRDVVAPLELIELQEAEIRKRGLDRVWAMEQAVTPILVKMRRRGVAVDQSQLERMREFSVREEQVAWDEVNRLTGVRIALGDGMKAKVVAQALEAVDILPDRTATGDPSITKDWLENLNHPVGGAIRQARKMSQLRTTFVASVESHMVNGRIHCTFNQIVRQKDDGSGTEGAAYGRLSCVDPNLQQQPARDPNIGKPWRKVYVPDDGGLWCSNDYSQQEPRLAVHAAVISGPGLIGARAYDSAVKAARAYKEDPTTDAHDMFCTMVHPDYPTWEKARAKQTRTIYKNTYLGICYGEGEAKMCRDMGFETVMVYDDRSGSWRERSGPQGRAVLDLIDEKVPYVKATAKAVESVAKKRGYIRTVMGRQLHFPKDRYGNYDFTHKAFNRFIQGSAADQTKTAMIALDREGFPIQLQIHDELAWTVRNREEGELAAKIMEECLPMEVPSRVDVEVGPSWGEAA